MKDKKVIRTSQQGLSRGNHALPIRLWNEMTGFVDEERAVDIGYLNSRKVSHKILTDKLLEYGLNK